MCGHEHCLKEGGKRERNQGPDLAGWRQEGERSEPQALGSMGKVHSSSGSWHQAMWSEAGLTIGTKYMEL